MSAQGSGNRTVFVTGSDRGIGKAIAIAFARTGAKVAVHGLASPQEAQAVLEELREAGSAESRFFSGDLRDPSAISDLLDAVTNWGHIDILVNNAGIQKTSPLPEVTDVLWNDVLAINLSAPFHLMRRLLPNMAKRGFGRIINIASVHGLVASVNKAPYVTAKFGLVGLSRVAALEYASVGDALSGGVTVNCICPGFVDTTLLSAQISDRGTDLGISADEAVASLLSEKQPSRRLSFPDEIARLAVWLSAAESHNITEAAIPIDGGWTAQ